MERRYSFTIGSAFSQPTRLATPSLLISSEPSQVQTPELNIVLDPVYPSSSVQEQTAPSSSRARDPYTQSLFELHEFLQDYELSSQRGIGLEISPQDTSASLLDVTQNAPSIEGMDLTCHEELNGNGST
eukprot:g1746.t1